MEQDTFAQAVQIHGRSMFRAARTCGCNAAEAEDAVGEAVLRAWQSSHRLRNPDALKAWLIKITVNCARESRRKFRRETTMVNLELQAKSTPPPDDPSGLWEAVCLLPQERRAVVVLYYYDELGVGEIAQILGVPQGTVKSRLSRAREQLRTMLKEDEYEF